MSSERKSSVTYKMMAEALFENYECIYDINLETREYHTHFQSEGYRKLEMPRRGADFFQELPPAIRKIVVPEDQERLLCQLQKEALQEGVEKEKYYKVIYQIQKNGQRFYYQMRATMQMADDGRHVLLGVKNIDDVIRQQLAHANEVAAMRQKDYNHLEAVLSSAAAYMEANLTDNIVLEQSPGHRDEEEKQMRSIPSPEAIPSYDAMQEWILQSVVASNGEKYRQVSSRDYLLSCFARGEKRASVSFSAYGKKGGVMPCKAVFYLYQEKITGEIHLFCVIYDLTEQQKKERELRELEAQLHMSRIRNSTSQMQPHFLYNALGSIQEVMLMDPQYASDLLGDFTVHLRSCVRAMSCDDPIPFSEEMKNIRAYVNIEKMRLGDRLEVEYDVKTTSFKVLPLSIQPLVENAIRHGIYQRGKTGGKVTLRTREEPGGWLVQVEDTGVGFDAEKLFRAVERGEKDSTGLTNLRFRLEKMLGAQIGIESTVGRGTLITVRLPRKGTEHESTDCG